MFQFDSTASNQGLIDRMGLYSRNFKKKQGDKIITIRKFTEQPYTYIGRLGSDLEGDIPNGITIRIELEFDTSQFCIMTHEDESYTPTFIVHNLILHCPVAELEDSVYASITKEIKQKPYIIPYVRQEISTFSINKGTKTFLSDTLFSGSSQLPSKIAVVFVETDGFRGDYGKNPFNFQNSFVDDSGNICEIMSQGLYLNGNLIDGLKSETPIVDFFKMSLYAGFVESGFNNGIKLKDYQLGNYIVNHDLTTSAGSTPSTLISPGIRVGHCR